LFKIVKLEKSRHFLNYVEFSHGAGPVWLPIVGCAPQLKKLTKKLGYQQNVFLWLSERYNSPVIGLRLGSQLAVAVSGYQAVRQIFTREEFEGRPDTFFIRMRSMGTRKGFLFPLFYFIKTGNP